MDPTEIALWLARGLGTITGLLLLYAAFFLYPGERQQLQSLLEVWWIRLDDTRRRALDRQPILIQAMADTSRAAFDWLFGEPLGKRFFIVSGLLSMTSFTLAMSTLGDYGWAVPSGLVVFGLTTVWAVVQFGRPTDALNVRLQQELSEYRDSLWRLRNDIEHNRPLDQQFGVSREVIAATHIATEHGLMLTRAQPPPASLHKQWSEELVELLPMVGFVTVATSSTGLVLSGAIEHGVGTMTFLLAILTAFLCDAASIWVTMEMLDRLRRTRTAASAAGWLLLDAAVAAAMLLIPLTLYLYFVPRDGPFGTFLVFLASANLSTALPSLAYLLIALGLVLHRLLWPFLLRPFYNLVHAERIRHPKAVGALGLTLLLASWPELFTPLRPIVDEFLELV